MKTTSIIGDGPSSLMDLYGLIIKYMYAVLHVTAYVEKKKK